MMSIASLMFSIILTGPTPAQESTQQVNNALLGARVSAEEGKIAAWIQHLKDQTEKLGAFIAELAEVRQQLAYIQQLAQQLDPEYIKQLLMNEFGFSSIEEAQRFAVSSGDILGRSRILHSDLQYLIREGQVAQETINRLREAGYDINDDDYLEAVKALSKERDKMYQQRLAAFQEALNRASENAKVVSKQIEQIPNIEGAVEAAQMLATQLTELNISIREAQIASAIRGQTMAEAANAVEQILLIQEKRGRSLGGLWTRGAIASETNNGENQENPPNGG